MEETIRDYTNLLFPISYSLFPKEANLLFPITLSSRQFGFILSVDSEECSSECQNFTESCENRRINDSSGRCEESPRYQNYSEHDEQRSEQDLTHRLFEMKRETPSYPPVRGRLYTFFGLRFFNCVSAIFHFSLFTFH